MFIRQKLLKHGYADCVTDIIFFIECKIYFLLVVDSKGIINTLEKYYVAMKYVDVANFTFAT